MPGRVLIVEDSEAVRRSGLFHATRLHDFHVVGEARDGFQAINQSSALQPDVILLDVSLPNLSGIEAVPRIHQVSPESKVLMFSLHNSAMAISAALNAGALGYLVKSDAGRDLLAGLRATGQGEAFFSSCVAAQN